MLVTRSGTLKGATQFLKGLLKYTSLTILISLLLSSVLLPISYNTALETPEKRVDINYLETCFISPFVETLFILFILFILKRIKSRVVKNILVSLVISSIHLINSIINAIIALPNFYILANVLNSSGNKLRSFFLCFLIHCLHNTFFVTLQNTF